MKEKKSIFAKREEEILAFWQKKKIFEKSLQQRKGSPVFSFYDGPPFATGLPHYGHLVASLMKDVIPRYQTMRGKYVERRWGWDCHGLPIENIVEGELGLKSKKDIIKIGVAKFNEECRKNVMKYRAEWRETIDRFGRWVDMDNDYKTMDESYMESIWWVFKELWEKGLIYEDYKSMHICPRCETTLAQAEVTEGYRDIEDLSVTVKFELVDEPGTYVLAWTTTPWTLIGNVALAVGKDIRYIKMRKKQPSHIPPLMKGGRRGGVGAEESYIIAEDRAESLGEDYKILEKFNGKELEGKRYNPLFDYYLKDTKLENRENLYTIQTANFVSTKEGTGIVHIAPAFGEDDMNLAKAKNLPFIQHVKMDGTFTREVSDFPRFHAKPKENPSETDEKIIEFLKKKHLVFSSEKYTHSYPHCWRCESPLLNYATSSWFVAVTKIKERMLKLSEKIHWMPEHMKEGRFGNWLSGARDWAISRQRFWGSVIPIWKCHGNLKSQISNLKNCKNMAVVGSVAELEKLSGKKIEDLHKHKIDEITFLCPKCKGTMSRIPDVLDCWFESGSMPYAQQHYPFENIEKFKNVFPAEFIAEGVDQTIKWFYYLHVIATAIQDNIAFENVVVNGIVLSEDGKKMSKRLKNYPAPKEIFDAYGADAMRYYLLTSGVMKAEDLCFSEKEVIEVYRNIMVLLDNILKFYKSSAEKPYEERKNSTNYPLVSSSGSRDKPQTTNSILDQWIEARLTELISEVTVNLDNYDLARSSRPIEKFINDLSTWYLRRSRERFKQGDKAGVAVFGHVLTELSKLMAPFMPFTAEYLYQELKAYGLKLTAKKESVHLEEWPTVQEINKTKNQQKEILKNMEMARKIVELGLAKRAEAKIKVRQPLQKITAYGLQLTADYVDLIKDELNVKEVEFIKGEELKVELDTAISAELKLEGEARELIRQINQLRKELGLTISDFVRISYEGDIDGILKKFGKDIIKSTLAKKFARGTGEKEIRVNEKVVKVKIQKI